MEGGIKGRTFTIVIADDDSPHAKLVREMFGDEIVVTAPKEAKLPRTLPVTMGARGIIDSMNYERVERYLRGERMPIVLREDPLPPPRDDLADLRAAMRELRGLPRDVRGIHGVCERELDRQGAHAFGVDVHQRGNAIEITVRRRKRGGKRNERFIDLRAVERAARAEVGKAPMIRVRMG